MEKEEHLVELRKKLRYKGKEYESKLNALGAKLKNSESQLAK